jgi:hypothetical protein
MNYLLPAIFLFLALCLTAGCADSSGVRPVVKMSYGLDFVDAQRLANVECRKLNAQSARIVNGEPDYTFECVEFESTAEKIPIVEVPIIRHGPLD